MMPNASLAMEYRTITIKNQCAFDVLWGTDSSPITSEGKIQSCNADYLTCNDNQGLCGKNNLCYYKSPEILYGKDNNPDYYLASNTKKNYKINLIASDIKNNIKQYKLNIFPQYKCSNQNNKYSCLSANCIRDDKSPLNNTCIPEQEITSPHTVATIEFNNQSSDFYYIDISNGVNIPVSVKPIGDFEQNNSNNLFCLVTGNYNKVDRTNDINKLKGCSWDFYPPSYDDIQEHLFTQIDRDINSDMSRTCQTSNECPKNQRCGLKYPEDLQNYQYVGYCGEPLGYYSVTNICGLDNASSTLHSIFNCSRNLFYEDSSQSNEIPNPIPQDASVLDRCPNDFFEVSLKGIENSTQEFCNYELFNCRPKEYNVNGKTYKYLDSCYNYRPDDPASSTCCGCIDWHGIPTNNDKLCMRSVTAPLPNPCEIDFSDTPPDCTAKFDTKISMPNMIWLRLVQPYLGWLINGCPDAKEYSNADSHSVIECRSNNNTNEDENNINYEITFCPDGKSLFTESTKTIEPSPTIIVDLPNYNLPEKTSEYDKTQVTYSNNKIISIFIFIIFTIIVITLVIYYANKREN